jgi:SEC-C motif-containing protein
MMRSRYTAYSRAEIEYLYETSAAPVRRTFSRTDAATWAKVATFTGLEVHGVEAGAADDDVGMVDFTATWTELGTTKLLRERSRFVREAGAWRYSGGDRGETVRREGPKVGRNDPCPCSSGKKHKKCCG